MKKKKRVLTEEQLRKKRDAAFQRKIKNTFVNSGFCYLKTSGKEFLIGGRKVELDSIFYYENIMLICEDTGKTTGINDHIRTKDQAFKEIINNVSQLFEWLFLTFPENKEQLEKYDNSKYRIYFLYFSQNELSLTNDERSMYPMIRFVEPQTLSYFYKITQCIKLSAKYEIFRFLNLKNNDIGLSTNEEGRKSLKAPIIYPKDITGIKNNVRVVSFMMSADSLLSTSYVMRKDNWEESMWLYQRLIDETKIKKIRRFIAEKGESFYNNIIVGLPDNVSFRDPSGNSLSIDTIGDWDKCVLEIPDEMNSICVIDGQHRIFAHYEGDANDKYENKINLLRKQLHLLVTGLVFPKEMTYSDKIKIQSEIFLDINSNAKPVQADVLLNIEMLKNPLSDIGIARRVIERLNKEPAFLNRFEFSTLDSGKIKIASIIKFALRYLVTVYPQENKTSFFDYWNGDKTKLLNYDEEEYKNYINFCSKKLNLFFSALKNNYKDVWDDKSSKILSVISLNGFIIAFNRQLKANGIKDFAFYDECLKKLNVNFSDEKFSYTSSQYRRFSDEILVDAFEIEVKFN